MFYRYRIIFNVVLISAILFSFNLNSHAQEALISCRTPKEWTQSKDKKIKEVSFFYNHAKDDKERAVITISPPEPAHLSEGISLTLMAIKSKVHPIAEKETLLFGFSCFIYDYISKTDDGEDFRARSYFILKGNKLYSLTYVASPAIFDQFTGDFESFVKSCILTKGSTEELLDNAKRYSQSKQYVEAITELNKAIDIDSNEIEAYEERGLAYLSLKRFTEAKGDFNKAIDINPNDSRGHLRLGNLYRVQGNFEKAENEFNKAIQINDDYSIWAINNRGWMYRMQGKLDLALADSNKVIELNSNDPVYYVLRGNVYFDRNEIDKAFLDFNTSIKINPKISEAHFGLKMVYEAKGDKTNSDNELKISKELDLGLADKLVVSAKAFQKTKMIAQMKRYLNYAIEVDPNIKSKYPEIFRKLGTH